jgi:hypothetical protein
LRRHNAPKNATSTPSPHHLLHHQNTKRNPITNAIIITTNNMAEYGLAIGGNDVEAED